MIEIEFQFDEQQIEKLIQIPELLRFEPAQRIMKAMSQPVLRRAQVYCPDSSTSGSRKKWSQKARARFGRDGHSKDNLGIKVVKHNRGARVYVGGKWPKANKLHFLGHKKGGRTRKLWGKDPTEKSGLSPFRKIEKPHWLQKAYDETKSEQNSIFIEQLTKELKELKLG